jgi:hypothetical protein
MIASYSFKVRERLTGKRSFSNSISDATVGSYCYDHRVGRAEAGAAIEISGIPFPTVTELLPREVESHRVVSQVK